MQKIIDMNGYGISPYQKHRAYMEQNKSENAKKTHGPGKTIEVLFKISEAVSRTRNLDELYRVIHKSLDEILNVDNFYIVLHDKEKDLITFPYHVDEKDKNPEKIINFSRTPSFIGRVIQRKQSMIFFEKDMLKFSRALKQKPFGTVSKVWLGAPLIVNENVKGVMVIQNYASEATYKKEDLALLTSVSRHIALAIERKESEETLTKQRQMLEKILESLPVGIALLQDRIFKWVNNEMVRLFGYESKTDFENQSTRMIYSTDEDFELFGEKIYKGLSLGGKVDYELELVKSDRTLFPAHIRLNSRDDSHPMALAIAVFTDISERKIIETERFEKERLQGVLEMAGAICHEINQPLQAILGYSELLLMGSDDRYTEKRNVHSIKSQAARLDKITKKLSGITHYRTVDYPGNTKIIDIWGAGSDKGH